MNFRIDDKPVCHCGVFGVYGSDEAALETYYGLHALQHRGQEASGILTRHLKNNKPYFNIIKGEGLVSEVFDNFDAWGEVLIGNASIGHNRYSTTGSSESRKNIQPFFVNYRLGNLAVAHNGNLTNANQLRNQLVEDGAIFQTTSDTEIILHLIARSKLDNQVDQIREALLKVEGAYSFIFLTDNKLIAARDPFGFRPLSIGKKNGHFLVASETCAFDIISAEYVRDVLPGEIIVIDDEVMESKSIKSYNLGIQLPKAKHCIFEYIYFSRPDSRVFNHNVDKVRRRLGKILARNYPVTDPDGQKVIVISVPDSSNTAAIGYENQLEKMDIPAKLEIGLIRSHYIGRTFIQPGQQKREIGVRIKFNIVKGVLENRTIVLIDDSIVRGTTSKQLVALIREAKPKSIHLRISSPPVKFPCYYGMDFPSKEELVANQMDSNVEKIREYLGVDSLEYLTITDMLQSVYEEDEDSFCTACFSGDYPTQIDSSFKKDIYEV
ncbi:MAG: amidophosphoribosyltransferase [Ignavibacteriaceae bacterium]|nr:amidophosphoribosyltransferase [Ignavibacteriaceae bacterium]